MLLGGELGVLLFYWVSMGVYLLMNWLYWCWSVEMFY